MRSKPSVPSLVQTSTCSSFLIAILQTLANTLGRRSYWLEYAPKSTGIIRAISTEDVGPPSMSDYRYRCVIEGRNYIRLCAKRAEKKRIPLQLSPNFFPDTSYLSAVEAVIDPWHDRLLNTRLIKIPPAPQGGRLHMDKTILLSACLMSIATPISSSPVMTRQSLQRQLSRDQFCSSLLNFNNFYYSLEEQKNITGIPADMSIHWKTGKVFFTLISDEMKMSLQVLHASGEFETIKVAGLGQSTCVDNLNDIVYLATDNGVYKYKDDNSMELYTALGEDVMYIAVSSDGSAMYIATWPQNRVHKITNDGQKQESFSAIPNGHGLTVDPRNNVYFVATKTSYILKNGYTIPIKIKGLPSDKMTGVFVSRSDEVFAMDENSNLYLIDPDNTNAKHLGSFNVNGVNSFAMDSADNVLIGVKGAILKFQAHEKSPCPEHFDKVQSKKGKRHSRKRKSKKRTTTTEAPIEEEEEE